ncbi:hypothetical protein KHO57_gp040 [Mycobacterium phage Phabba]|uniref:Uncharacterized protein n=1 Tax=Mycobacterium phage Phabba TaxID=2027899 RepID=A0A249XSA3_9CAUD|nr:hypothetical protein KHO57_gp040 [Mycobacterium phage Phabba]ASZ74615.1 hypothetical protein SEA_PHABBA_40 [Mycobacterium phage Phabba]
MTLSITGVRPVTITSGEEARKTLAAAMLGMEFTDERGNHDVQVISARIRDELMVMGYEMQLLRDPDIKARLERAVARLQEKHDELHPRSGYRERERLAAKIDGVKLALSYFGDYQ